MRVVLVGPPLRRDRLRRELTGDLDIVSEASTLGEARRLGADVDAYIVAARPQTEEAPLVEELTARETEVLSLLVDGLSNKAIAEKLGVSDETVKFHLTSIFGKLGASNRTDAVTQGLRRGLVWL